MAPGTLQLNMRDCCLVGLSCGCAHHTNRCFARQPSTQARLVCRTGLCQRTGAASSGPSCTAATAVSALCRVMSGKTGAKRVVF
jgi:hypothetical protein